MKLVHYGSHLLLLLLSLSLLLISLPIEVNATQTFYNNNQLYIKGTLKYIGSSTGYEPVDNLNNKTDILYFNAESERSLSIDPYLTNMTSKNIEGWLESGYEFSIPFSGRVNVTQQLYTQTSSRQGTAYYDVVVDEIQTILLYRTDRSNTYITYLGIGLLLISAWSLFKVVRCD